MVFLAPVQKSGVIFNFFRFFRLKSQKGNRKTPQNTNQLLFVFVYTPTCLHKNIFADDYYPSGYFPRTPQWADSVSQRMNTITSRDQFKPIRIVENLVVNYNRG